ncbi:MAG: hypothetical protein IT336_16610, partial [Thermomicrobiales bacterium]|nr:hypothetical protein [Thermomicrobiales bacterium]
RPATAIVRPDVPSPLLSMIEGELAELLRPIRAMRAMPAVLRGPSSEPLLLLGDGRPLAIAAPPGSRDSGGAGDPNADNARGQTARGLIVYIGLALDLEWSDLPTKPLLLPLVQEIVRQGASVARGGGVVQAGALPVASPGAVELVWNGPGAAPAGAAATGPLQPSGVARQAVRHAGVDRGVDAAGASRGLVLINADTSGSDTETRSQRAIAAWLESAGAGRPIWLDPSGAAPSTGTTPQTSALADQLSPGAADNGESRRDLSWLPLLFGLALAIAVVEAITARVFSHAGTAPAKGGA